MARAAVASARVSGTSSPRGEQHERKRERGERDGPGPMHARGRAIAQHRQRRPSEACDGGAEAEGIAGQPRVLGSGHGRARRPLRGRRRQRPRAPRARPRRLRPRSSHRPARRARPRALARRCQVQPRPGRDPELRKRRVDRVRAGTWSRPPRNDREFSCRRFGALSRGLRRAAVSSEAIVRRSTAAVAGRCCSCLNAVVRATPARRARAPRSRRGSRSCRCSMPR
jgi:hypothetical protein